MPTQSHLEKVESWFSDKEVDSMYRLVSIFSSLCERRILLRKVYGQTSCTDGTTVWLNWKTKERYVVLEHELSHIVFDSNPAAIETLIRAMVDKVMLAFPGERDAAIRIAYGLCQMLDDVRVRSLWAELYPGSAEMLKQRWVQILEETNNSVSSPAIDVWAGAYGIGMDTKLDQPIETDIIEKSIDTVILNDYASVLKAVDQIFDELIRQKFFKNKTPEEPDTPPPKLGDDAEGKEGGKGGTKETQDGEPDTTKPAEGEEGEGEKEEEKALKLSTILIGGSFEEGDTKPIERSKDHQKKAGPLVFKALKGDDPKEGFEKMQQILDKISKKDFAELDEEEHLSKKVKGNVIWEEDDGRTPIPLDPKARVSLGKARAMFKRLEGQRMTRLMETGADVDIQAYISSRLGENDPCVFRNTGTGQGFSSIVLMDFSSSMGFPDKKNKIPFESCQKAAEFLRQSMNFPFTDLEFWGFTQKERGSTTIKRFDRPYKEHRPYGNTPLHVAVTAATEALVRSPLTVKRLFVLTDGSPTFAFGDKNHKLNNRQDALLYFVKAAVEEARENKIGVYALAIGDDMTKESLGYMFGREEFWRQSSYEDVYANLVDLIINNFKSYLKHRR